MSDLKSIYAERGDHKSLEADTPFAPKFDADGLITAIAVDHQTHQVLMVAYMNAESLKRTIELGEAVYFSRSRQKFWHKGEESGNIQQVTQILTDCDQDCLVVKVKQFGDAACHTGRRSCFYREVPLGALPDDGPIQLNVIDNEQLFDPEAVYGKQ